MEVPNFRVLGSQLLTQMDKQCVTGVEEEILKSLHTAGFVHLR